MPQPFRALNLRPRRADGPLCWATLWLALAGIPAHALADEVQMAQAAFGQARDRHVAAKAKLAAAQRELEQADEKVAHADPNNFADVRQRTADALDKGNAVADAEVDVELARQELADARQRLSAKVGVAAVRLARPVSGAKAPTPGVTDAVGALVAGAGEAQAGVGLLNANAKQAFLVTDEARAIALALAADAIKAGAAAHSEAGDKALAAIQQAQDAHAKALEVHRERYRAQPLSNEWTSSALQLAGCVLNDCEQRAALVERTRQAGEAMTDRIDKSKKELAAAKLLSYRIKTADVGSETEQAAAIGFLAFIDRNPNAGWKFGGESATLSAGADGATAAIRVSLQRIVNTWARDTTLTLSSPVAKGGDSTALLSSSGGYRPEETSLRLESTAWRALGNHAGDLVRFAQIGLFGQVSRLRFTLGNPAAVGDPSHEPRTALALGGSAFLAAEGVPAAHRFGFSIERGYDAGPKSTRCQAAPDPINDPVTGNPTGANQVFLRCATAFFNPIDVAWARKLEYRYRREWQRLAIAPAITYEHTTRTKTYELPLYLVRGEGDNADKFTAGVAYRHISVPGEAADKRWEIFVSSPLSMLSP